MQSDFSTFKVGAITAGTIAAGAAIVSTTISQSSEHYSSTETSVEQAKQPETQPLEISNEFEDDKPISSFESSERTESTKPIEVTESNEVSDFAVTYEYSKEDLAVSATAVNSSIHDELNDISTPVTKLSEPVDSGNPIQSTEPTETADETETVLTANPIGATEEPEDIPTASPAETDEAPAVSSPAMTDMHVVRSLIIEPTEEPEDIPTASPAETDEAPAVSSPVMTDMHVVRSLIIESTEEPEDIPTASPAETDEAPAVSSPVMPDMHVVRSLIIEPTEADDSFETSKSATINVDGADDLAPANIPETAEEPEAVLTANPTENVEEPENVLTANPIENSKAPTVSSPIMAAVVRSMIIEPVEADNSAEIFESTTESVVEADDLAPAITELETAVESDSPLNPTIHSQSSPLVAPVETLEHIEVTTPSSEPTESTDTKEPAEVIPLARNLNLTEPTEFIDIDINTEPVFEHAEPISSEEHVEADQGSSPVLIEAVTAETVETDFESSPTLIALTGNEEPKLALLPQTLSRSIEQSAETDFTEQVPTDTSVNRDELKDESEALDNDNALDIGVAAAGGIALAGGLVAFSSHDGESKTPVFQADAVSRSIVSDSQVDATEHTETKTETKELLSPVDEDHDVIDNTPDEADIGGPTEQRMDEAKKSSRVGRYANHYTLTKFRNAC